MEVFDLVIIYFPSAAVALLVACDAVEQHGFKRRLGEIANQIAECDSCLNQIGYYPFGYGPENWRAKRTRLLCEFRTCQSQTSTRLANKSYTDFVRRVR